MWSQFSNDITGPGGDGVVPLSAVPEGKEVIVRSLEGGHAFAARMVALGLVPGSTLRVVRNVGKGPLLVEVRDTRLALGRGAAHKVMVSSSGKESYLSQSCAEV